MGVPIRLSTNLSPVALPGERMQLEIPVPLVGIATVLVLVLKGDGSVQVCGPIDKPELCRRVMQAGQRVIEDHNTREAARAREAAIVARPPGLPPDPTVADAESGGTA